MIPLFAQESYYDTLGLCHGGGGSSGGVDFPTHMKDSHKDWLGYTVGGVGRAVDTDLIEVMNSGLASNPTDGLSYTDPATAITEIETEWSSFDTAVTALDEETDIGGIITAAVADVDAAGVLNDVDIATAVSDARTGAGTTIADLVEKALDAIDSTLLAQAVQQYVNTRRLDRAKLRTRFKTSMVNIGAERSSAFAIGLALLESEFEKETGQYQTDLSLNMYDKGFQAYLNAFSTEVQVRVQGALTDKQTRDNFLSQTVQQMATYKQFIVDMQKTVLELLAETHRVNFVMDSEYVGNTADLNIKNAEWDFDVFGRAVQVLGGIGGGTVVPPKPSKAASALGGALSGAGTGAAIGGPVGAGVGAVVGGLAGLL